MNKNVLKSSVKNIAVKLQSLRVWTLFSLENTNKMFVNHRLFTLRDKSVGGEPLLPTVYFLPLKVESTAKTAPTISVQFSPTVPSNSLRPHGLHHARPPCPSPTPNLAQTHAHRVSDTIQPSHPLSSPSPAFNLSQHQGLFKWVSSLHQGAKVLEFQLQHQSFQWIFRTEFF